MNKIWYIYLHLVSNNGITNGFMSNKVETEGVSAVNRVWLIWTTSHHAGVWTYLASIPQILNTNPHKENTEKKESLR